jgi:hypothetical protein
MQTPNNDAEFVENDVYRGNKVEGMIQSDIDSTVIINGEDVLNVSDLPLLIRSYDGWKISIVFDDCL